MPLTDEYCNLKTIETVAQGFSVKKVFLEICEISENTFSYRTPLAVASQTTCLNNTN